MNNTHDDIYSSRLSVREFVEFVCRSGDIDTKDRAGDPEAMREGQRLHKKIQNSQPEGYTPELPMSGEVTVLYNEEKFLISLDGRADGVIRINNPIEKFEYENKELSLYESNVIIDEIKCMYTDVKKLTEPVPVHIAQAKCYAFFCLRDENLPKICVQMSYCGIEHEDLVFFTFEYTKEELTEWFMGLATYFAKWMYWEKHHFIDRNETIKACEFPFEYRPGQKELVKNIYLSILRDKKIFIEAPTGVGKTISAVYPSVKAMGEGLGRKLFYLTARTITRTVAEETAGILKNAGVSMLAITLTAKEKLCLLEKPECSPLTCPRAKGHEDRVNEAVYDLITHEKSITRQVVESYAEKHNVCPFEFALDISLWCDMIICDYNYCFDPNVYLRRFFAEGHGKEYLLLVDEAHNLVDRAREMYSASIYSQRLKDVRPYVKAREETRRMFTSLANLLVKLADVPDGERKILEIYECEAFFAKVEKLYERLKLYVSDRKKEIDDEVMEFFFDLKNFVDTIVYLDENYCISIDRKGKEALLRLNCMNPRMRLMEYLRFHRGPALYSATLLPVKYYMDQLGGDEEDYAVYAPSPFDSAKRKVIIASDVSAKYTRRNRAEYEKLADYIDAFVKAKTGNYLIFFPSYKMMDDIYEVLLESYGGFPENFDFTAVKQESGMSEEEREAFLECFTENPEKSMVGFCVMGGIFSEGIDLKADRLIGVAIVGTGLPMVGPDRELFKNFYDDLSGDGFEHAYLWPGMNKVLQAGGRVIRTEDDRGVILLLDDRFTTRTYQALLPKEWENRVVIRVDGLKAELDNFWKRK
ncbi:MAG: ATP-dependent DNA helicase [Lachnospiraceae bacterium]|nr:ATP-dependent DNA helicase [Lachnospiraceae bacterium]